MIHGLESLAGANLYGPAPLTPESYTASPRCMSALSGELMEGQPEDFALQLEGSPLSETKDVLPVAAALEAYTIRKPH